MKSKIGKMVLTIALTLLSGGTTWAAQPNVVLIFIDDMGYADIGPFGNTQLRTPHLDQLATQGRKFTSFYAAPTCTMSRASLMTGSYNPRVSLSAVLFPGTPFGLNPDETTIAEVMKKKDYATSCIGKWHLGDVPELLPMSQGFDEYFGLPYSNDMHAKRKYKGKNCPPLPLIRGNEVIETEPDQSQLTRRYTEEAIRFIREKKDVPFFLYLPHTMIHFPLAASANFKGKSKMGLIGDTIEEIDWSVGEIMQTLEELGLEENTLVIFTSDNGPAKREAPPLRGDKGTTFEGGVRVPTIMRWPGHIPAGTSCDQISGVIDVLPTFAALIDVPLDPDRVIDGKNILPLMLDENPSPVRTDQLYFIGGRSVADGIRDGDWKLFTRLPVGKKAGADKGPWLYNLKNDIGESKNVAAAHPEIVDRLTRELKKRDQEINKNKRPAGKVRK